MDAGGTFTDVVAERSDGSLEVHKLPSTPHDPGSAVAAGEREVAGSREVALVIHGSTVATNAFLEGRLAAVGLIVPRGFEDVLAIGRQRRRRLYSLAPEGPRRLVPGALVRGIGERISAAGDPVVPLDLEELDGAADELVRAGAATIVIAFLHSARHPDHERAARDRLAKRGLAVVASHEVTSEPREYERWATAVVDAGLAPVVGRYIEGLAGRLRGRELRVMLSSGGTARASDAAERAVSTILSGPAAGVVGARLVARAAGFDRLITFDMGGTSCDVAVVPGEPLRTTEAELDGVPLRIPLIDIQTVGAGGGSVAWVDRADALRVGPRSAGADPGPACYGAGGEEPTLTDAHLALGQLDPGRFLGGRRPLDPALAERALDRLARTLGAGRRAAAGAVVAVARGHLERAVRRVTLERGHDPADFTLVAFGGAGGLHAAGLAAALGCRRVLVPRAAGVLSALGCLAAEVRRDFARAVLEPAEPGAGAALARRFADMEEEADRALAAEGVPPDRRRTVRSLAMRYRGQSYEVDVPSEAGADPVAAFHRAHAERYGHARPEAPVEIVAARVAAVGAGRTPALPEHRPAADRAPARRTAWIDGREVEAETWGWVDLPVGHAGSGPALVFDDHATALVPPGWRWRVDVHGNVVMETGA
ncbi:MAG TPA: hydantoinase/oxoprolinase family protein [Gemmatimonadota bacterium]|nr:hydantoinase/oxoprolinase family protein [Gemmatimonadota bacterium]